MKDTGRIGVSFTHWVKVYNCVRLTGEKRTMTIQGFHSLG